MAFTDKLTPQSESDELRKVIKELRKDLSSLQTDMNDIRKDTGRFARAGASAAHHNIEDAAEHVFKRTREQAAHLKSEAEDTTQSLRQSVRDNPIAALGIATVVGMLLGRRILR